MLASLPQGRVARGDLRSHLIEQVVDLGHECLPLARRLAPLRQQGYQKCNTLVSTYIYHIGTLTSCYLMTHDIQPGYGVDAYPALVSACTLSSRTRGRPLPQSEASAAALEPARPSAS